MIKQHPLIGSKQTPEHIAKRRAGCAKGGKIGGGWNKGLTKETNESMAKTSRKLTGRPTDRIPKHAFKKGQHPSPATEFKIGQFKGEKHPNWKGGVTTINHRLRSNLGRYNRWRESVFKRDNYTCQKENCKYCNNQRGGKLNSHHIVPVSECIVLDYEDLVYDTDNGMTLCKEYHKEYHGERTS